jgi:uncharacterized membrane protein YbaN (DUF454 family)
MNKLKKAFWITLGFLFLGVAYIGIIMPGIPWSTPTVIAAFCFARGSERWHNWIMNHKLFGPFLRNWGEKRVFPTKAKWAMFITMDVSIVMLWITTQNWKIVVGTAFFMMLCAVWAWRYPGSVEEWKRRVDSGLKVGWFK